jgi:hypothetical protein
MSWPTFADKLRQRGARRRQRRFFEQWFLAYRIRPAESSNDDFSQFVHWIPPADRYWADPFPVLHDGVYYLFFEEFLTATQRGRIVVSRLKTGGSWTVPQAFSPRSLRQATRRQEEKNIALEQTRAANFGPPLRMHRFGTTSCGMSSLGGKPLARTLHSLRRCKRRPVIRIQSRDPEKVASFGLADCQLVRSACLTRACIFVFGRPRGGR